MRCSACTARRSQGGILLKRISLSLKAIQVSWVLPSATFAGSSAACMLATILIRTIQNWRRLSTACLRNFVFFKKEHTIWKHMLRLIRTIQKTISKFFVSVSPQLAQTSLKRLAMMMSWRDSKDCSTHWNFQSHSIRVGITSTWVLNGNNGLREMLTPVLVASTNNRSSLNKPQMLLESRWCPVLVN